MTLIISILLLVIVIYIIRLIKRIQKQKQLEIERLKAQLTDALVRYNEKREELQLLNSAHQDEIQKIHDTYEEDRNNLIQECDELKKKIALLKTKDVISKHVLLIKKFYNTDVILTIKKMADKQRGPLLKRDVKALLNTMTQYFPAFMQDLNRLTAITQLGKMVCILTALNLRSGDIANLLEISFQQVSNLKKDINRFLFNDGTAFTLYKNLVHRYDIYAD